MNDFIKTLEALFVAEYGKTPDEAAALVRKHPGVVMHGIMRGPWMPNVRATAMAIEMAEAEDEK